MKFCDSHWQSLVGAIQLRELYHLVKNKPAVVSLKDAVEGVNDPNNYDPLMSASLMISGRVLRIGGAYLLQGDYCPLCELDKNTEAGTSQKWIDDCTDNILGFCRENHLVPMLQ